LRAEKKIKNEPAKKKENRNPRKGGHLASSKLRAFPKKLSEEGLKGLPRKKSYHAFLGGLVGPRNQARRLDNPEGGLIKKSLNNPWTKRIAKKNGVGESLFRGGKKKVRAKE